VSQPNTFQWAVWDIHESVAGSWLWVARSRFCSVLLHVTDGLASSAGNAFCCRRMPSVGVHSGSAL